MKTILGVLVAIGTASLLSACQCKLDEPDLIEHRMAGCERMCEVYTDPECGSASNPEVRVPDFDTCVKECATSDGDFSSRWGYVNDSGDDLCIAEFHAYVDCLHNLACEDQQVYFSDEGHISPETRPCFVEDRSALDCAVNAAKQNQEAAS